MRILFASDTFPYPPDQGTKVRDYHLIRRLSERCEVSLLAFTYSGAAPEAVAEMRRYCADVEAVPYQRRSPRRHLPALARGLIAGQPPASTFMFSPEFAARLAGMTARRPYDVVQIDCSPMAPYHAYVARGARTSLVFIDVNAEKLRRQLRTEASPGLRVRTWLDWLLMCRWEARYAQRFDLCIALSDVDARRLRARNPKLRVEVIPNGVDTRGIATLPPARDSATLLLVGTLSHVPWADAVRYFHARVFPLVRAAVPAARLSIVGAAPDDIRALASEHVSVSGWVPDVEPYYREAALAVVPLRAGGGTRLKILEALAYGRPVVSTGIGCEGLDLVLGEDLLVADEPAEFARQVVRVLTDDGLRGALAARGRRTVEARCDWGPIAERLLEAYARLAPGAR